MHRSIRLRHVAPAILAAAISVGFAPTAAAQVIITGWSFEGVTVSATAGMAPSVTAGGSGSNINSDQGTVPGTATALHASSSTVYSTPVGNGSAKSFSSNFWAIGDYYQFSTNTTGQAGVQLLFDQTSSGTGPTGFKVSYSTDGGSNFTDLPGGSYTINPAISFSSATTQTTTPPRFFFDGNGALDNVANLVIRLVDTTAPSGTAGTSRVDNFLIGQNLAPIPEPSSLALLGVAGVVPLVRRWRKRRPAV
jgi:PEP-CTERM motif